MMTYHIRRCQAISDASSTMHSTPNRIHNIGMLTPRRKFSRMFNRVEISEFEIHKRKRYHEIDLSLCIDTGAVPLSGASWTNQLPDCWTRTSSSVSSTASQAVDFNVGGNTWGSDPWRRVSETQALQKCSHRRQLYGSFLAWLRDLQNTSRYPKQ